MTLLWTASDLVPPKVVDKASEGQQRPKRSRRSSVDSVMASDLLDWIFVDTDDV